MRSQLFYWIINMSIVGSLMGSFLCLLRRLKKFPRFGIYILWSIVWIRFICPVGITSQFSLTSWISKIFEKQYFKVVELPIAEKYDLSFLNTIQTANTYWPITFKYKKIEQVFQYFSIIWLLIAVILLVSAVSIYLLSIHEFKVNKRNKQLKEITYSFNKKIYEGTQVYSPAVYGIINPSVVLPENLTKEEREFILHHEKVHIRRLDNLWRFIVICIVCIQWFNPLVWWFLYNFQNDCELACDAGTIRKMDKTEKAGYALLLVTLQERNLKNKPIIFQSSFQNGKTKRRVQEILSYRSLAFLSSAILFFIVLTIAIIMLSNG